MACTLAAMVHAEALNSRLMPAVEMMIVLIVVQADEALHVNTCIMQLNLKGLTVVCKYAKCASLKWGTVDPGL